MRDIKKKEKIPPKRKNRRFSNIEKQKLLSRTTDADRSEQERSLSSENAERLEREMKFVGGAGYSAGKSVARRMHTLNFRKKAAFSKTGYFFFKILTCQLVVAKLHKGVQRCAALCRPLTVL